MSLAGAGAPPTPGPGPPESARCFPARPVPAPRLRLHSAGLTICQRKNSKTENPGMKKMLINLGNQTHMGGLWIIRATHSNPFQMGKSRQLSINPCDLFHPPHLSMINFPCRTQYVEYFHVFSLELF